MRWLSKLQGWAIWSAVFTTTLLCLGPLQPGGYAIWWSRAHVEVKVMIVVASIVVAIVAGRFIPAAAPDPDVTATTATPDVVSEDRPASGWRSAKFRRVAMTLVLFALIPLATPLIVGRIRLGPDTWWPWTHPVQGLAAVTVMLYVSRRIPSSPPQRVPKAPGPRPRRDVQDLLEAEPSVAVAELLVRAGKRNPGMNMLRQVTGMPLHEARAVVQGWERGD